MKPTILRIALPATAATTATAILTLLAASPRTFAAEEPASTPYKQVDRVMLALKSQKIHGVDCVPWFVRSDLKDAPIDPKKANFRIVTKDGKEHPLDIDLLSSVPKEQLDAVHRSMIEEGYTHRLWIPKGVKEYQDAKIVHSLPKGTVAMSQGICISGKIP